MKTTKLKCHDYMYMAISYPKLEILTWILSSQSGHYSRTVMADSISILISSGGTLTNTVNDYGAQ